MTAPVLATWNLRGLQRAGFSPWPDFEPYSPEEFEEKLAFHEAQIRRVNADVLGLQEVAEVEALDLLHARVADLYPHKVVGERGSGSGLRVGLFSRFEITGTRSHEEIPEAGLVRLTPEGDPICTRFRRPVLAISLAFEGGTLTVFVVHLKAKRPDLFEGEVEDDPVAKGRGMARSLAIRAADSAGLRTVMTETARATHGPVVLMGDLNDGLESVTTRMLGGRPEPAGSEFIDGQLYNVLEIQRVRHPHLALYTHIWQDRPDVLDHIIVSADLARRFEVLRIYNDFLEDSDEDRTLTDHGFVVARFGASPAEG